MRTKVTLILVFLNVALFFYIIKFEPPGRSPTTEQIRRVLDGKVTADIRSLEISGGGPGQTLALAKRGDTWFVTQPLEWPANPAAVSRILTELQFLEHLASFNVGDLAKNGQSLADYGLDHPKLTIAITSGDPTDNPSVTRLQVGDLTKDGLRLYLLSPDGERVHVVNQSLAQSLGLSPNDLRADALFTIPVFEARSLNLQTAAPANLRIRLRRDGSKWSFETPIIARASKTATELAINGLNGLRVASFITANPPATLPSASPSLKITLEGNNRRETLLLGGLVRPDSPNGSDEYYAQLEGRSALFTVRIPSGPTELMNTLRTAQVSLRETHILDFDAPAVTAITLTAPNAPELILQRLETGTQAADTSAWQIVRRGEATVGPQTLPADRAAVSRLLDQLSRLAVTDFNTDFKSDAPTAADLESWGFNRPEREVFITLGGGTAVLSLQLGTDAKHNVYARLGPAANPGSSIYAVNAEILRELPVAPRAWRDRLLRELPAGARLTALKLTDLTRNNEVLLEVAIDDTGKPPIDTKNPEAIATVLTSLRTLRAKEFILDQFADKVTVAGEERPWRYRLEATATLVGGAGEQTSVTKLFLTSRVGGDQQLAGSPANEYNAVFSIEQPLLDALWTLTEAPRDPGPIPPAPVTAVAAPAVPESTPAPAATVEPKK